MNSKVTQTEIPEQLRYTKYYEHEGLLRAYANRAWLATILFGFIALGSFIFAVYVRLQPPTIIRVDKEGNATVVGGPRVSRAGFPLSLSPPTVADAAPTDLEGKAVVRHFLEHYLIYTPDSVDHNFSEALNLMTINFRTYTMNKLRDDDVVGKIREEHIISDLRIRSIERVRNTPWTYVAFGVNELHRVRNGAETTDRIVGQYTIRLVGTQRDDLNPSGLLVAEYGAQQMVGDRENGLAQKSQLEARP